MAWSAGDVVFGGRESFGWDECLPTVAPCPDPLDPSAAPCATTVTSGAGGPTWPWTRPLAP